MRQAHDCWVFAGTNVSSADNSLVIPATYDTLIIISPLESPDSCS